LRRPKKKRLSLTPNHLKMENLKKRLRRKPKKKLLQLPLKRKKRRRPKLRSLMKPKKSLHKRTPKSQNPRNQKKRTTRLILSTMPVINTPRIWRR